MAATELGLATYGLAFIAGNLSTLSPCVLPLIPILVGTAMGGHRLGPLALGSGLALSFATTGTLPPSRLNTGRLPVVQSFPRFLRNLGGSGSGATTPSWNDRTRRG